MLKQVQKIIRIFRPVASWVHVKNGQYFSVVCDLSTIHTEFKNTIHPL